MVGGEEAAAPSEKDVELAATGIPDEEKPLSQSYTTEETAARRHSESQDEALPEDCADRCEACCSAFASRWVGPILVVFLTFAICAVCHVSLYEEARGAALRTLQILQYGLAGLALVFLALTNCTDPGSVVLSDQAEMLRSLVGEKEPEGAMNVQKDITQEDGTVISYRWCTTCRIYRPPRASHCRECNRCFMRFDHHCPWVGNCIAESNHRFFTGFLTTVSIAGLCVPAAAAASGMESGFVKSLFQSATEAEEGEGSLLGIFGAFFVICLICLLITCSGLACFAVEQCVQLLSDITTKERYGREQKEMDCSCLGGSVECHLRQICFSPMRCRRH